MTTPTDTPRTDKIEAGYGLPNTGKGVEICYYTNKEWADFARTLERENRGLRERLVREQQASVSIATMCLPSGCEGEDGGTVSAVREMAEKLDASERACAGMREALGNAKRFIIKTEMQRHKNEGKPDVEAEHLAEWLVNPLKQALSAPHGHGFVRRSVLEQVRCSLIRSKAHSITDRKHALLDEALGIIKAELDRTKPKEGE